MPLDNRRFNGPEDSVPYRNYIKGGVTDYHKLAKELISQGRRKDGRSVDEVGQKFVFCDVLSQAKGSGYVEICNTKAICAVYDPREIPHLNEFSQLGQLFCEIKFASFSSSRQRRSLAPDAEERSLSVALRQALEPAVCRSKFPNYQVDIFVYILEDGGSCLSAAINAAGLALANAAVPMYDTVLAASIAIVEDKYLPDPTEEEEYVALLGPDDCNHGVITMSILPRIGQVTSLSQVGSIDVDCVQKAMDLLHENCSDMEASISFCLTSYLKDALVDKETNDEREQKREKMLDDKIAKWLKNIKKE